MNTRSVYPILPVYLYRLVEGLIIHHLWSVILHTLRLTKAYCVRSFYVYVWQILYIDVSLSNSVKASILT